MEDKKRARFEARAKIIKAMAHPTLLFIVYELSHQEKCVCELTQMIGADMSTLSKHLSILENAGIVQDEIQGTQIYYKLKCSCILEFIQCVETIMKSNAKKHLALVL